MTFPTLAGWEPVYLWGQSKCTHESHPSRLLPLPPSLAANNSSLMPRVPAEAQAGRPVRAGSRAGATPQLFISSGCRQPSWIRAVCLSLWCQVFSCFSFSNENLNLTIARETQNQITGSILSVIHCQGLEGPDVWFVFHSPPGQQWGCGHGGGAPRASAWNLSSTVSFSELRCYLQSGLTSPKNGRPERSHTVGFRAVL